MKNTIRAAIILISTVLAACGNNSQQVNTNNVSTNNTAVDCMPVIRPIVRDSAAIVKTPTAKDSIAISQDSLRRHR